MTKTPQQEYQENLDFVRFLGGVAGSLNDINSKVVEGRLRSENFDIKQLALAHDKAKNLDQPILAQSNGVQPPQQGIPVQIPPQLIPAPQQPIATPSQNADFTLNDDYWRNWWKVYGEGQIGMLEGVVFSNWKTIDTIPSEARLLGIGLDFGFTNDPSTAVAVYKWNDKRIVKELFYRTGLLNADIANLLPKDAIIYADSAEPKSIEEIRRRGLQIYGAEKGRDSITYGTDLMQQQEYLITSDSTNLIKELRGYCWDTDKTGKRLNKPQGGQDHAIDALRYHEVSSISTNKGVYNIY